MQRLFSLRTCSSCDETETGCGCSLTGRHRHSGPVWCRTGSERVAAVVSPAEMTGQILPLQHFVFSSLVFFVGFSSHFWLIKVGKFF